LKTPQNTTPFSFKNPFHKKESDPSHLNNVELRSILLVQAQDYRELTFIIFSDFVAAPAPRPVG